MNRLDEKLIKEVFDAMLVFDQALEKYKTPAEDGRMDGGDLADNVIKAFPLPIGIELRRLFAMGIDRERIDQVLKLIERSMQFTAFILVTQLLEEILKNSLIIPAAFSKEFKNRFSMLAMGDFAWIIRSIGKIFKQSGKAFLVVPGIRFLLIFMTSPGKRLNSEIEKRKFGNVELI
jgi:hypothetical protein